jgi:hypothetical protein
MLFVPSSVIHKSIVGVLALLVVNREQLRFVQNNSTVGMLIG